MQVFLFTLLVFFSMLFTSGCAVKSDLVIDNDRDVDIHSRPTTIDATEKNGQDRKK